MTRKNPSIKLATNGIILSWEEYGTPKGKGNVLSSEKDTVYDHEQWLGTREKVFTLDKGTEAFSELIKIGKECGLVKSSEGSDEYEQEEEEMEDEDDEY